MSEVEKLCFLTKGESWKLFCKCANAPRNRERFGREMVAKSGGLPLARLPSGLVEKSYEICPK